MKILVLNSGSSSIKYKVFEMPEEKLISKGVIEHIGEPGSKVRDHHAGLEIILRQIDRVFAVGHRVVHGEEKFYKPALINDSVIKAIKRSCEIAPLHNPANLFGILACKKLLPGVKQVAVFDTAFHQTLPDYAYIYGLPYEYYKKFRIRKYGFHGTSHEYVARKAARILKRPFEKLKLITCHLGNGCSIAAIKNGKSIDTSMGFTPLEGLIMGTRSGDIDAAIVTYLILRLKIDANKVDYILNNASGLKGISGISNDMRVLENCAKKANRRARLAIEIFVYRIKKYIGSYAAILGGADALVFTAGIGENSAWIRRKICAGLFRHMKNAPRILVIPTDEELMIAHKTCQLIEGKK